MGPQVISEQDLSVPEAATVSVCDGEMVLDGIAFGVEMSLRTELIEIIPYLGEGLSEAVRVFVTLHHYRDIDDWFCCQTFNGRAANMLDLQNGVTEDRLESFLFGPKLCLPVCLIR